MSFTYEVVDTDYNTQFIRRSDGAIIPINLSNSDYQRYLNPEVEHLTEIPTTNQLEEQANDQSL